MIQRLSSDSRRCAPGVAFFAYPGETADGRAHIPDAISRGASAVLWEEQGFSWPSEWRVANIAVPRLKLSAGPIEMDCPFRIVWTRKANDDIFEVGGEFVPD